MMGLQLGRAQHGLKEILCLGAHSDDIEIGCGGAIVELIASNPGVRVVWAVFSANAQREKEALRAARRFLKGAGSTQVMVQKYRDGFFPAQFTEIKEFFEQLKHSSAPDLVFTHYRFDRHQDHRTISDLTWNTFRNHFVLEYEIPKYDGDVGLPNAFVPLGHRVAHRKVRDVCAVFESQRKQHWFTPDLFLGLMRLRGIECCAESGFAEAFHSRKAVIAAGPPPSDRPRKPRKPGRRT